MSEQEKQDEIGLS